MSNSIFKRCGCSVADIGPDGQPLRGPDGRIKRRQLAANCPKLKRADGAWNPGHGTWWFHHEVYSSAPGKRSYIRQGGHATSKDAENAMAAVAELLAIAARDDNPDAARTQIADMVRKAIKAKTALPSADDIRKRTAIGQPLESTITVEEWLVKWLRMKKDHLRPTTRQNYTQQCNDYLIPLLGHHRLDRLRAVHVRLAFDQIIEQSQLQAEHNAARHAVTAAAKKAWRDHDAAAARAARARLAEMPPFRRPVGAASVQRIRAALRSALSDAVIEQIVTVNVAKLVKLASGKPPKPQVWTKPRVEAWRKTGIVPSPVMVWTTEHTCDFLARAALHRLFALFLLITHCGLRRGEACGLRWQDVDLEAGTVDIRQQIVQIGWDTEIGDTKTDAGERTVMLADPVVKALKAHRLCQDAEARGHGPGWIDTGLVFTCTDGSPLHPALVTDLFARLAKEAGLPPIRLHDLRHGTATHALSAGVALKVVSEMLGHSTTAITADMYTSVVDEVKAAAAKAIAAQFDPKAPPAALPPAAEGQATAVRPPRRPPVRTVRAAAAHKALSVAPTRPKHRTAAQLADFLTDTPESDLWPGTLSLLDEATEPFCVLDPDVEQAYTAFATARHAYAASERDTPHGTDARDRVVEAARILGDALQPLGDVRITRCARLLVSGEECELPLDGQGECGSSRHTEHA